MATFALAAVLALAAGCAGAPAPAPTAVAPESTATASDTPPPAAEGTEAVALAGLKLALEPVVRGLEQPLQVTGAGDGSGRLFVVEQAGRVRVVRGSQVQQGAFLDLTRRVSAGGERGLLGIAFAPNFETSGVFYADYTNTNGDTVIARFTAEKPASDSGKVAGPDVIATIGQPFANHNGGCIVFAPDGTLWVGMGDGGSGGDPQGNAQNPRSLLGKMLSFDVTGTTRRVTPKIVMSGLRNPWRFSFDRETGDVWIGDVGQGDWEEIDFAEAGSLDGLDWGWNLWEGTHPYPSGSSPSREGFSFPITEYSHSEGQSVTGGFVYRGAEYPALVGTYLYADYSAGWIAGIQRPGSSSAMAPGAEPVSRVLVRDAGRPSSFGEDDADELYLCDHGGTLYRVTAK